MKRAAGLAVSLCMFLTAALGLAACGISETQTQESTADARETESTAENASPDVVYKYYTSIRVGKGDSLWSIADRHADGYFESKQDFLQEVIQINHLLDSDIRQGDYLIIPYYSSEFKR